MEITDHSDIKSFNVLGILRVEIESESIRMNDGSYLKMPIVEDRFGSVTGFSLDCDGVCSSLLQVLCLSKGC